MRRRITVAIAAGFTLAAWLTGVAHAGTPHTGPGTHGGTSVASLVAWSGPAAVALLLVGAYLLITTELDDGPGDNAGGEDTHS